MNDWVTILGVFVGAWGLRTFRQPWLRKVGAICVLVGCYLAAVRLTGSTAWGVAAVVGWFFLPWLEIWARIRPLRLPLDKPLRAGFAPPRARYPELGEMTGEVEDAGFVLAGDVTAEWGEAKQYIRLFWQAETRWQAAISIIEQDEVVVLWGSISSRTSDGRTFTTWNFPLSATMQPPPEAVMQRNLAAESFADLVAAHTALLAKHQIAPEQLIETDPDALALQLEAEARRQVDHNLDAGLITLSGEGTFRYSWRGYFFLWRQFVWDMVRHA
jgi:hypothetical protein